MNPLEVWASTHTHTIVISQPYGYHLQAMLLHMGLGVLGQTHTKVVKPVVMVASSRWATRTTSGGQACDGPFIPSD